MMFLSFVLISLPYTLSRQFVEDVLAPLHELGMVAGVDHRRHDRVLQELPVVHLVAREAPVD